MANWVTHGFFVGHVVKIDNKFPQTLDGAYDHFRELQNLRGLTIGEAKTQAIGNGEGKIATYTSPSVLRAGESGWIAVVKDKNGGYYWLSMFYPSNDDAAIYLQTLSKVVKTLRFKN